MYLLVSILIVIAAVLLIFIVIVQNAKGGGLAAGFSSSNQIMGVRKTTDFLEKATWGLGAVIVFLCIFITLFRPNIKSGIPSSEIKDNIENAIAVDPNAVSPFGSPMPGEY